MKTLLPLIIVSALIAFQPVNAQSDKSQRNFGSKVQTIYVQGVCGMCKKRIETAALKVDGVQSAVWNENSKKLSVKYSVHKREAIDEVERKISAVGHDAGNEKATDEAYKSLPECCQYRS